MPVNKAGKPNALLIELVIVLLFFSLSASVILQLFAAAHEKSVRGSVDSAATIVAEDMASQFAASDLTPGAFFALHAFDDQDGVHILEQEVCGRTLRLEAETTRDSTAAGDLDMGSLTVYDGELSIVTLPIARYIPKEGTP